MVCAYQCFHSPAATIVLVRHYAYTLQATLIIPFQRIPEGYVVNAQFLLRVRRSHHLRDTLWWMESIPQD